MNGLLPITPLVIGSAHDLWELIRQRRFFRPGALFVFPDPHQTRTSSQAKRVIVGVPEGLVVLTWDLNEGLTGYLNDPGHPIENVRAQTMMEIALSNHDERPKVHIKKDPDSKFFVIEGWHVHPTQMGKIVEWHPWGWYSMYRSRGDLYMAIGLSERCLEFARYRTKPDTKK